MSNSNNSNNNREKNQKIEKKMRFSEDVEKMNLNEMNSVQIGESIECLLRQLQYSGNDSKQIQIIVEKIQNSKIDGKTIVANYSANNQWTFANENDDFDAPVTIAISNWIKMKVKDAEIASLPVKIIPDDIPFTVDLKDLTCPPDRPITTTTITTTATITKIIQPCPKDKFINVEEPTRTALDIISKYMNWKLEVDRKAKYLAGFSNTRPIVIPYQPKCGKTTLLKSIFEALKAKKDEYLPIFIDCENLQSISNLRNDGESQKDIFLKLIASQLLTFDQLASLSVESTTVKVNEVKLIEYLKSFTTGANPKKIVFCVDDFHLLLNRNQLRNDYRNDLCYFCSNQILKQPYFYLIYTSNNAVAADSAIWYQESRGYEILNVPKSMDIARFQSMPGCEKVTSFDVCAFCGIPALVYVKFNEYSDLEIRNFI